jgi:DUF1680 family protein
MMMRKIINKPEFFELNLGEVVPRGWLREQLKLQAKGLTGFLEEIWKDVGPDSGWLGGNGESWERGPYYCDGLIPLAYILEDEALMKKAEKWVKWTLKSQREDGFFGPESNEDWWSRMVMLKVLKNYYEYTADVRVLDFLTRYFRYQLKHINDHEFTLWEDSRATENILVQLWLYEITHEDFLIELAKAFLEKTKNWSNYFENFVYEKEASNYLDWQEVSEITDSQGLKKLYEYEKETGTNHYSKLFEETHIVNVVMAVKYPALRYLVYGEENQLDLIKQGIKKLMYFHGTVNGMITGDEHINGNNPSRGTELCAVVEYMYSLQILYRTFGDSYFGDLLEKITYNALPATLDKEIMSHQYDQQANQIMCSIARRDWYNNLDDSNIFGLEPNFGCCTANMHQGWPKFVKNLCYKSQDEGLVFGVYGPCEVKTQLKDRTVTIKEITGFPFREEIEFEIGCEQETEFPIYFRVPQWSGRIEYQLNSEEKKIISDSEYIRIKKKWKNDKVRIKVDFGLRFSKWFNNSIGVESGPLVFALPLREFWNNISKSKDYPEYEVYTNSQWNYALNGNEDHGNMKFSIHFNDINEKQPFNPENPPLTLDTEAKKVDQWSMEKNSAGTIPLSPLQLKTEIEQISLIPYGCARLRISQFPYYIE